ncbi:flagellar hook-associated protein FlgK [Priestia abyssalis]|uniref:flagellar hook-associated protein FlgK n=1 Tax=Priestia abyssalis TaxID=1221450 RepID=UPI0009952BC4|nr:flagellar hook-associated protein FlgK [Priestia abyssalis]
MISSFYGLEVAKRAMAAQQAGLYTTSNNIANANTQGYTRQRVNLTQSLSYPGVGRNQPNLPGQLGSGVQAGSIQRVREEFLDVQYRSQNNTLGYWTSKSDALAQMETIMNEPSDSGLSAAMDQFWKSLQDLSANPEDEGVRAVVRERGEAVAETFRYLHDALSSAQTSLEDQRDAVVKDINSLGEQIAELNKQIAEIERQGQLPNALYDERDQLIDQLSQFVDIKVEAVSSGRTDLPTAAGIYNISIVDSEGNEYSFVNGKDHAEVSLQPRRDEDGDGIGEIPPALKIGSQEISLENPANGNLPSGKLRGLIEAAGSEGKGLYPEMISSLNELARSFAASFNDVHTAGYALDSDTTGISFFEGTDAASIKVSGMMDDLANIAASTKPNESGNGDNAKQLASIFQTVKSNYQGIIGKLGTDGQQAERFKNNADMLLQSADGRRQSVNSVSLDEEMTNMIQFQHAYNAAARMITVTDEMLDKIINGMGMVGR